jgi:hypothetical protein
MSALWVSLSRPGRVYRSSLFLLYVVCAVLLAVTLVCRVPALLTGLPVKPFLQNDNHENKQEPATTTAPRFTGGSQGILPISEEDYNEDAITVTNSHPRLFGTQARWNTRTSEIASDAYLSRWNISVFDRAAASYVQEPLSYPGKVPLDGNGALDVARELQQRIKHWAYVFRMSGDVRWKDRVWNELLVASGNSTRYFGEYGDNWHSEYD